MKTQKEADREHVQHHIPTHLRQNDTQLTKAKMNGPKHYPTYWTK